MRNTTRPYFKQAFFTFLRKTKSYDKYIDAFEKGASFRRAYGGKNTNSLDSFLRSTSLDCWISEAFGWSSDGESDNWAKLSYIWDNLQFFYSINGEKTPSFRHLPKYQKTLFFQCFEGTKLNKNTKII